MPSTAYVTLTIMPDAHTKSTSCALALAPPPRNPNERRELLPRRHREVDSVLLLFAVWRGFVDAVNRAAALGGRLSRGYHVRARKMDAVREELCDSATDAAIALEPLELCHTAALPLATAVHAELQSALHFLLLVGARLPLPADAWRACVVPRVLPAVRAFGYCRASGVLRLCVRTALPAPPSDAALEIIERWCKPADQDAHGLRDLCACARRGRSCEGLGRRCHMRCRVDEGGSVRVRVIL